MYAEGARLALLAGGTMLMLAQAMRLAVPWLAGGAINALQKASSREDLMRAAFDVGLIVLVYCSAWLLHGPGRILERQVGVRVRQGISAALYRRLTRLPVAWHERHHSGEVQHRVTQASTSLYDFAQHQFIYLQNGVNIVGPVLALMAVSQLTGAMAFGGYLLIGLIILRFDRQLMGLARAENDAQRHHAAGLIDFVGNIATIVSLRLQQATERLLQRRLEAVFAPLRRSIFLTEAKWCAVDLLSFILTWGLVLFYGWQTHDSSGTVLIGSLFIVHQYAQQAGSVIGSLATHYQHFSRLKTDYASADPIWDGAPRATTASVDAHWQEISAVGLQFSHQASAGEATEGRGGLHGASLELRRGGRIALVGPSGSGKSTLMRVMAGLYEKTGGWYLVDGLAQAGVRDLSSVTTLLPQDADIFEASVRDNLTLGEACDDAALSAILRATRFDTVLAHMADGLETVISERGVNLSGGQRQRLALARGLVAARGSSLVMLDEPTSALDPITEDGVVRAVWALHPHSCIIASVHRMSLLRHFDTVVFVRDGCVVDVGSRLELAARQPDFAALMSPESVMAA